MKYIILTLILLSALSIRAQEILMRISNPQVNGNQVVYDVSADNFTDMIAAQFVILYDTQALTFVTIENAILPGWNDLSYNENKPGSIVILWLEPGVQGFSLENGMVMFQLVFDIVDSIFTSGNVCFSEEPQDSEFVGVDGAHSSFSIIDDCHAEPFQIILDPSGTDEIARHFGLSVNSIAYSDEILFSLASDQTLRFRLFDLHGKLLRSFPVKEYTGGEHSLKVGSQIIPAVYVLVAEIQDRQMVFKVFGQ